MSQPLDNPNLLLDTWNQQGARWPLSFPGFIRKHALYRVRLEELQGVGWSLKRRKLHHSLKQPDNFSCAGICRGFCLDISDGKRVATTNRHILKPMVPLDLAWIPWGFLDMKKCAFYGRQWPQPPVWLKPFPRHRGIVVVNVGLEPGVVNRNPGTGRWDQTTWRREEQLPKEKWRCPREEEIAVPE